ncbi:MAG: LuxR C-terminal-related transcriptional regulator [Candidatus Pristimantibacillus sp.]
MRIHNRTTNRFIGRRQERDFFQAWLEHQDAPLTIITVTGISGVGKSTLLSEFIQLATDHSIMSLWLDGRGCAPTPAAFIEYISATISLDTMQDPPSYSLEPFIEASPHRRVALCIDNYEDLRLLERWITEAFLPKLPLQGIIIVLASRPAFSMNWYSNPLMKAAIHPIYLSNFTLEETASYWNAVEASSHDSIGSIYRITEGHPLALALTLNAVNQNHLPIDEEKFIVSQQISVQLLRELTHNELQPLVDVLTILHTANQELLSFALQMPVTMSDYQALKELSFIRITPHGLSLHDVARNHLLRDFKLREPDRLSVLRNQILKVLCNRLPLADKPLRRNIAAQMLLLCKDAMPNLNRSYADLSIEPPTSSLDVYREGDLPALQQLIDDWSTYSLDPGQVASYHQILDELSLQFPESIAVLRDSEGHLIGMSIVILLHQDSSRLLNTYFSNELAECCEPEVLSCSPDQADTYFALLVAAKNNWPGYTREELVGNLILDRLSLLGEGTRAVLVATNSHLKQFLQQLGFVLTPTVTRHCDTSYAQADVMSLDLRDNKFGDWVQSFLGNASSNGGSEGSIDDTADHRSAPILTSRELEVLQLIAEGSSNKEIANQLMVTIETIKTHVRKIFYKLNVDRRMKAVAVAKELLLLDDI